MHWISGTLELTSKVRYGISTHGLPLFRFIPYDKKWLPFAVACSMRDFSTNVHAIIEPLEAKGTLQRGAIVQLLGKPSNRTEEIMALMVYAYDSKKDLRKIIPCPVNSYADEVREVVDGYTFHIDPVGCKDVDDAFTCIKIEGSWKIYIHIADVSAWISPDSQIDKLARRRGTTFYSLDGKALAPMFPPNISEESASLLPGLIKPAVSLEFTWKDGKAEGFRWTKTLIQCNRSFTYEEAMKDIDYYPELGAIRDMSGDRDSHMWVQHLMILYNTHAGTLLRENKRGILRRHSGKKQDFLTAIGDSGLSFIGMAAAEYVDAKEENVVHVGLQKDSYAYASSPIRRYCDLVNQRILKDIITPHSGSSSSTPHSGSSSSTPHSGSSTNEDMETLITELNRRQKQEKSFSRDMFFLNVLSGSKACVKGIALTEKRMWVAEWKRCITMRTPIVPGGSYTITWYENKTLPHWKDRIVFKAELDTAI
jgi:exoribonuclease R